MVDNWKQGGAARAVVLDADPREAIGIIFTGMGSLSYGELAGERMKLGLLLHDPEEEHDCFSDNTHMSHLMDAVGIRSAYLGSYKRIDGSVVSGPSFSRWSRRPIRRSTPSCRQSSMRRSPRWRR